MRYLRVRWLHSHPDEPVWLISEIDANRRETRKVEIFADGHQGFASQSEEVRGTRLGQEPIPPLQQIGADPQFVAEEITQEDFEAIWSNRLTARRESPAKD